MFLIMSAVSNRELYGQSSLDDEEPLRLELMIMTVSCLMNNYLDEIFKKTM